MNLLKTTIETADCDRGIGNVYDVMVHYTYHRGYHGKCDSLSGTAGAGQPLEPDEPPSVEINSVIMHSPTYYNRNATEDILDQLSELEIERMREECYGDVAERYERDQEERQDYR